MHNKRSFPDIKPRANNEYNFRNICALVSPLQGDVFISTQGPIQKLRNCQCGEGVDDFVTYRYVLYEGEGGYFIK